MTVAATVLDVSKVVRAKPRTLSLAQKFAIAFLGLVAAVLIVNGAIDMMLTYRDARVQAVKVQQEKANAAAERVVQFVSEIEQQLGWTTRAEWSRVSVEQRRYDFIRLLRQAPAITELVHVDGAAKEQLKLSRLEPDQVGSGTDYSAEPRYVATVRDKIYYGPVTFRRGSEPYMTIGIVHAGRNPGATIADVNLKLAWDVVTSIRVGTTGYAYITDPGGRLIAHPDMSLVLRNTDLKNLPQVAAARSKAADAPAASDGIAEDGRRVLSANATVPKVGWNVFVELPAAEALGPVWSALYQTLGLLALGVALAGAAGMMLARRMVVPITELQAGAQKLGEGDLSSRIPVRSGDEIGALAQRFNLMAGQIQESQETLERKVDDRTKDLNEALKNQTATAGILKAIAASPSNVAPVLKAIVERACDVCGAYDAALLLKDGPNLRFSAHHGPISIGLETWPLNRNWTAGRAVIDKKVVHVQDLLSAEGDEFPDGRELSKRMGHRSILSVPLLQAGESIGALVVRRGEVDAFSDEQVALLTTFADQAVIAIDNVRLFNGTKEALERQNATSEVLQVISSSVADSQPVFDVIAERASHLTQADYGWVFLLRDETIHAAASFGMNKPGLEAARKAFPTPLSNASVTGQAILTGKVVKIADVLTAAEIDEKLKRLAIVAGNRSVLSVPMRHSGRMIGAITVQRARVGDFAQKEVDILESFADQAVIALENARLFKEAQDRTVELSKSLEDLRAAQDRLVQTEKLASLGQLTAGVAHEIKNPLNFVNNFADLSVELVGEIEAAISSAGATLDPRIKTEVDEIAGLLKGNLAKVVHHGRRADSIVKNMLAHSRESGGERRNVDLNAVVEEALNLSYHGARAEKPGFNITLERDYDAAAGQVAIFPQEFTRVLLNLIGNGFHAANKKRIDGAPAGFEPVLRVSTKAFPDRIEIRVRDNGTGIPDAVKARIFEPFFTTKPTGEGTGLGLSLSHDIVVKQHAGRLEVVTEPGSFTEFAVILPRHPISPEPNK